MYMNLSKLWEIEKDREAWFTAGYGAAKMTERLNNSNKSNDQSAFEEAVGSRTISKGTVGSLSHPWVG